MSQQRKKPILSVVVPCYNEAAVLNETANQLETILTGLMKKGLIDDKSFICFVNDGSRDLTWELILAHHERNSQLFRGTKLARNSGHQNALLAGLASVRDEADCVVTIDADLQDDVSVIEEFIVEYEKGCEIVYGVRKERKKDSFFKRFTALFFYRLMKSMGVEIVNNHADYRLISSRVVDDLDGFSEVNLFLRGIFPVIGYRSGYVYYDRKERFAGESKYPFGKMLSFAIDGITSFSVVPLRFVTLLGFIVFLASLLMGAFVIVDKIWLRQTVPGWASTVLPIYLIGGIQIISLGVIGEYTGKIYKETKHRPRYIIETKV
ncbi:MAG: glycosyltransferase family 2 protein [Patescibacteria group bacterium]|jgi:glycosyltransferase involved in cell wall biosynthesis